MDFQQAGNLGDGLTFGTSFPENERLVGRRGYRQRHTGSAQKTVVPVFSKPVLSIVFSQTVF
ncbi:hypothetical protein AA0488_1252 [Kozakia baliensis NRIC 0488]|nr:hypothetical protein AA0488_1252 [Kozakia baliensis NRIC 0488]GEL65347.1 hypothetical protein KBA01_26330 [Kozakia baliensis]